MRDAPHQPPDPRRLTLDAIAQLVDEGTVDTIVAAIPDMYGRLMGKRFTARFFLDEIAAHGMEACNYLLGCDIEMDPQPGYRLTSWESGYGDFVARPDLSTLRPIPWLEKTVLLLCDLTTQDGQPVEESPRRILQRQVERARALGYEPYMGSELELYLFKESYTSARGKHHHNLALDGSFPQDYHILQTTRDEWLIRQIRLGMEAAGIPVECSKGEWSAGQHEINLRFASAVEMADRHVVYKNGAKEIAALNDVSVTFMAKWQGDAAGSSCHVHSSLRSADGQGRPVFWEQDGQPFNASPVMRHYVAGQLALARDFSYFFAPTINSYKRYQSATFAPTVIAWGRDNRTCGFRVVGGSPSSLRIENRIPGADVNPYLTFAATIAAGLYGIEQKLEPPAPYVGDAYQDGALPRIPGSLREAISALEGSTAARAAFGAGVIEHYLNAARLEQALYDRTVTCWELDRYFERI
ncbi:MAG: glutamine synthetase [Chloroflexi bacterium]|nr:glutamine synthetase [Chloroflexota bacterium]